MSFRLTLLKATGAFFIIYLKSSFFHKFELAPKLFCIKESFSTFQIWLFEIFFPFF